MALNEPGRQGQATVILLTTLVLAASLAAPTPEPNLAVVLTLHYANASFSFEDAHLVQGEFVPTPSSGAYELRVLNARGGIQYRTSFGVDFRTDGAADPSWFDDSGNQIFFPTPRPVQTKGAFIFELPVYDDIAEGQVVKNETLLLSFPLDQFAICNANGICEPGKNENAGTCAQDCATPTSPNQTQTTTIVSPPHTPEGDLTALNQMILVGIVTAVLIGAAWFWLKKRKNAKNGS